MKITRRLVVGLAIILACSLMAIVLAVGQTHDERLASEGDQRYATLEAMIRDLQEELRKLKEGLNNTRILPNETRVEVKSGKPKKRYTLAGGVNIYRAKSAGFVTATANLDGAGSCILYGYATVTAVPESLASVPHLRAVSALQYAPGPGNEDHGGLLGRYRHEDLHPYIPSGSIVFPVRKGELWSVTGCDDYKPNIEFYALELSDQ